MFHFLEYISRFKIPNGVTDKNFIIKNFLNYCKEKRKGLTQEEIKRNGFNVYKKRGISVYSLVEDAIKIGFVKEEYFCPRHEKDVHLILTPKGRNRLFNIYTNNNCDDYLVFKDKVKSLTENMKEPELESSLIAYFYWKGKSLDEISSSLGRSSSTERFSKAYHQYLLKTVLQKTYSENDYIFHLEPQLFLSREDMYEDVHLEVDVSGINQNYPNVVLNRPYPNKRYSVAGFIEEKQKYLTGFYPIIAPKENFPEQIQVVYHWFIGEYKEVIHKINIQFHFDKGHLFSTRQRLIRSSNLPKFEITTVTKEDKDLFYRLKDVDIDVETKDDKIIEMINEDITLISFPMYLHQLNYGNQSIEKFREKIWKDEV